MKSFNLSPLPTITYEGLGYNLQREIERRPIIDGKMALKFGTA